MPNHTHILAAFGSLAIVVCALSSTGCGGAEPSSDGGVDVPGPGDTNAQVGLFKISLIAPVAATTTSEAVDGYTAMLGKVYTGPLPSLLVWEEALKDGDCVLLKPRVPVCSPECSDTDACVDTNKCQAYPKTVDVGTVTVTGVASAAGTAPISVAPISNAYQFPADVSCPFPGFAEGDQISVAAEGGSYGPFSLNASGIAPLTLSNETIVLAANQPIALNWNAATKPGSSIHVKLDIAHHGGVRGKIECDTADDGSLELSASLLKQLVDLGVSGFPTVVVTRISAGSAKVSTGHIDLNVISEIEKAVEIPGLVSCTDDSECPEGQTCQPDLRCM